VKGLKRIAIYLSISWAGLLLLGSLPAAADSSASATVKSASERMIAALEKQRSVIDRDPGKIYGMVDKILVPHFDFEMITRAAVGKNWSKASPAQKKELTEGFQQVLVRTYAKVLLNYSGQEIRYLPEKPGPRSTVVVPTQVREPGSDSIPIDYKLYKKGGKWKVYDVRVDNVSLVENYRGSFASRIRQVGIDGLISDLDEMNAKGKG